MEKLSRGVISSIAVLVIMLCAVGGGTTACTPETGDAPTMSPIPLTPTEILAVIPTSGPTATSTLRPTPSTVITPATLSVDTARPAPTLTARATATPTGTQTPTPSPTATVTPMPPSPTPTETQTPAPVEVPPTSTAEVSSGAGQTGYRYHPIGPARPELSQPCPGCPRAPGYIVGRVVDADGSPLAGVRLVCYNDWHRYPVVGSKGSGEYDFPVLQAEATWYVVVLDEADQPISPEAPVHFNPLEACWYRLDWEKTK